MPTEEKTVRLHPHDSERFRNGVILARYLRKLVKVMWVKHSREVTLDLEKLRQIGKSYESNWSILFGELESLGVETS